VVKKPERWEASAQAIRAVQIAFDVEDRVLEAVRAAAFENHLSTSDQIRQVLGLSVVRQAKRPRLTVSLSETDYALLGRRYRIDATNRLAVKERVTAELIKFADKAG
jgi:hypothetical protein